MTFDVPRQGAAYPIKVHPDLITVLHFPAEVDVAYCIQKPAPAIVERHPRAVAIQMKPGVQHASVNVVTRAFPVAVLAVPRMLMPMPLAAFGSAVTPSAATPI